MSLGGHAAYCSARPQLHVPALSAGRFRRTLRVWQHAAGLRNQTVGPVTGVQVWQARTTAPLARCRQRRGAA